MRPFPSALFPAAEHAESRTLARWIGIALAGTLSALLVALTFAPASFADLLLASATGDRIRLADTSGTVWRGDGRLMLADAPAAAQGAAAGLVVPGRLRWRILPLPLALGIIDAVIELDGMPAPLRINGDFTEVRLGAGELSLPQVDLSSLGSPWNTIRPVAALAVQWDPLTLRAGEFAGGISIELRDAASAMSQVRPLGSYRIDVSGSGRELSLALVTLDGALRLEGKGRWDSRAGVGFTAYAWGDGPQRPQLQNLLGLIGGLEGDRTVIRIGG